MGGKSIRKQIILLIALITLVMFVMGGVSAENIDSSSNQISANDVNGISDSSDSLLESPVSINVKVNYEYPNDINQISPDFYIVNDGKYLNFTKTFDFNSKSWIININDDSALNYTITAMSSGYISQSKIVSGNDLLNPITFDLKATEAYNLGMKVTQIADQKLDFKNADDILVISTAGVIKLNGKTTEDALEAILNYGNNIPYSNVLMLRQSTAGPIDFAFIVKKGNQLNAIVFENRSLKPSYLGTISENMSKQEWNAYYNSIQGDNAWSFASLANGWVAGVSREVLQEAAFHGHICEGTLGGFSIVQALLKYYPPIQESSTGGGSPSDVTSFKILGVPGGSDDDAAMFFLDATIGKKAYTGIDTTNKGATENMIGFIRWYDSKKTGDLIIMSLNSTNVKKLFTQETGIDPDAGSLEELKYGTWWINKINNNPGCLVDFLYEFTNLTSEQFYYLIGANEDDTGAPYLIDAHGLDMEYILSLNLPTATRTNTDNVKGTLTDEEMKQIGIEAARLGKSIFKEELGIDVDRDAIDFAAFTSAGYVYFNGQETFSVRDGLYEELGTSLFSKDMLQYHQALWKPLWFTFVLRHPDSKDVHVVYVRYDPDGTFFVGDDNGHKVTNIGIDTLNNATKENQLKKTFFPDGNWGSIQSIANAWISNPNFDQIISFLYHNHVCPGVQPGFFITDFINENYPLGENESYTYIASGIYCKDDSLTYLLGLSPGLGNYFVQKLPFEENDQTTTTTGLQGVFVIWDSNLNIGKAFILNYTQGKIDTSMYSTSDAKRYNQIQSYIDLYNGEDHPYVLSEPKILASCEKWITEEQFNTLKQGGDDFNIISYMKNLEDVSKEDLLKQLDDKNSEDANGGNSNDETNSGNVISNSTSNSNSEPQQSSNTNRPSQGATNVGFSSVPISSQSSVSEDNAGDSADDSSEGKAYEINKPVSKSASNNNLIYAIIGVLIVGVLFGVGYMKRKN